MQLSAIWLAAVVCACGGAAHDSATPPVPPPAPPPASPPSPPAQEAARPAPPPDDLGFCVEEVNRYRTQAGKKPLARNPALEAYAAEGAKVDAGARQPHRHFSTGRFPLSYSGIAENELPFWKLSSYDSMQALLRAGIASMWGEGPGGGHYQNIIGDYAEVGCGIYQNGDEVTVVQDYRQP